MSKEIQPYYRERAGNIIEILIELGIIVRPNTEEPIKGIVIDFLAETMQGMAESAARQRELLLKAETLLRKRNEQGEWGS